MKQFFFLLVFAAFLLVGCTSPAALPSSPETSLVGQAAHGTYNAFSAPQAGFTIRDGWITVSDSAVYKNAWYSANGTAWQPLVLSGSPFGKSSSWLSGEAYTFSLPRGFAAPGEHYLIVYSCTNVSNTWDCHGNKWQLQIVKEPYARVYLDKGSDCGDVLDYQCGSRAICGSVADFGDCPSGYDCADNLCIARDDLTCEDVTCNNGEYCDHGVCLLSVPGETYFVALWGNDSWSGNFTHPFFTWQRGAEVALPGDIVYIRGGVWRPTARTGSRTLGISILPDPTGYGAGSSGTAEAPIRYFNYPEEKPILDQELISPDRYQWNHGISVTYAEHIYFRGLTVRHIHQTPPNFSHVKPYSEVFGIGSSGANMRFENMVSHDIDGRGFQHWSYAWQDLDARYGIQWCLEQQAALPGGGNPASCTYDEPLYASDNSSWINCDAYNLFDRYSSSPGNAADGWKVGTYYGGTFTWEGCRAWNYSDDGFDPHGSGPRIFENCWAMSSHKYDNLTVLWGIEGNGYKMTGVIKDVVPNYSLGGEPLAIVKNSIAADCAGSGVLNNLAVNYDPTMPNNGLIYNNFGYKSGGNFWDGGANVDGTRTTVFTNNIAYKSTYDGHGWSPLYEVGIYNPAIYPHSNNTWRSTPSESWPGWEYNPAYNVTDEDFVSLDATQIGRPRKADHSLPDITFGHLAPDSDLIDGGAVIPGYHCATSGAHPGEDCREWYGAAPDLGPFEYNG